MRKFPTPTIRPLWNNTKKRFLIIKKLPKKWHKDNAGIFRIEDVNVLNAWDAFEKHLSQKLLSIAPEVVISDELAFKFAFYLHFTAQFFYHFGNDETDAQYNVDATNFFNAFKNEIGERNEESLFLNAFKNAV
jgi:hypothetical protein